MVKDHVERFLRRCLEGELQAFIGNALYLEYQDLLTREHIQTFCKQTSVSVCEFMDGCCARLCSLDFR